VWVVEKKKKKKKVKKATELAEHQRFPPRHQFLQKRGRFLLLLLILFFFFFSFFCSLRLQIRTCSKDKVGHECINCVCRFAKQGSTDKQTNNKKTKKKKKKKKICLLKSDAPCKNIPLSLQFFLTKLACRERESTDKNCR
jgi:hypothetical protein